MRRALLGTVATALLCAGLAATYSARVGAAEGSVRTLDQIAHSGHGSVFDAKFQRLKLTVPMILDAQKDLLARAAADVPKPDPDTAAFLKQVDSAIAKAGADTASLLFLQAAKANRLLDAAPEKIRAQYAWRNAALLAQGRRVYTLPQNRIPPEVLALLKAGRLIPASIFKTGYEADCQSLGVPTPPDFDIAGSTWQYQGRLTYNILNPGEYAAVWTYSDPARRGACIALPRRDAMNRDTFAGIICQGAATGNACFWDNLLRSEGLMARRIPWSTNRLVIADLQDGASLNPAAPCTECHTGNNVYLMTPDDAAWAKVLRGPLNGPRTGTFMTRIESAPGVPDLSAHYTPVNSLGWTNPIRPATCAGSCHETPSVTSLGGQVMPPACASGPTGLAGCYGTP